MKHISIVIPMYNEAEGLPALRARLTGVMDGLSDYTFEVLLVDDGSRDVSAEAALQMRREDGRFHLLRLSRNFGKEAAVLAGLDYADGDAVVLMDADLQDPPELIGRMLALWEEGYDDVYARRRSREGESGLKKFTSRCYYRMLARLSRTEIQPDTGDFRLFDRRCVLALRRLREQGRCGKSLFSWIGYRKKEILFDRDPRCAGETKWNYARLFELALDGIIALSVAPLRWIGAASLATGAAAAVALITVFAAAAPLWLPVLLFLAALQLGAIWLVSEYLGRALADGRGRPCYLVDSYDGVREENGDDKKTGVLSIAARCGGVADACRDMEPKSVV